MDIEEKAKQFATEAHSSIDQRRKYTNEPYINHPASVVEIVRTIPTHQRCLLLPGYMM